MKALTLPEELLLGRRMYGFFDHFTWYITAHNFTTVVSDVGTVAVGDGANGIVVLTPSDGTVADNDEAYLKGANEVFKFAADRPTIVEALVQFTEANTDDANIIFGLKDAVAADTLLDNGGGPAASYSGMVFFKVDGGTNWQCEHSIAGTQNTVELTAANSLTKRAITAGGASYQKLRIESRPYTSTKHDVLFFVDDVLVCSMKDQVYTNATEMQFCLGVKNGAGNLETLNCDYAAAYQLMA